ncbi:MAG: hypothetical protein OEY14_07005, partial [Myxococcales bacterium]|nr:hypothetical protein [Myxococcales bacterium]
MSDLLLELSTHPRFRQLVRGVGLPLPLPQRLRRGSGPISARPLEGRRAVMAGAQTFSSGLASMLAAAGAE